MLMLSATHLLIRLTERGLVPDPLIRAGIRSLLRSRLNSLPLAGAESGQAYIAEFIRSLGEGPIARLPEKANEQHYEVPADFFIRVLGRHLKYSGCYWPEGVTDLDQAEAAALTATCERAALADGQRILELGCGWGSLSLWMARHYPHSRIVAVSNSAGQRRFIETRAAEAGIANLEVITCDMNDFSSAERYDRIVSVEMFEHMHNWPALFRRVAGWLKQDGRFFMHVFCHRDLPYRFEVVDESDWMSRYFFSGGMMPSCDLPLLAADSLELEQRWLWHGGHYQKTANAWLANMDRHDQDIWPILVSTYGPEFARIWWARWRVFFMACAELFGYRSGSEWLVGHYLFRPPSSGPGVATP